MVGKIDQSYRDAVSAKSQDASNQSQEQAANNNPQALEQFKGMIGEMLKEAFPKMIQEYEGIKKQKEFTDGFVKKINSKRKENKEFDSVMERSIKDKRNLPDPVWARLAQEEDPTPLLHNILANDELYNQAASLGEQDYAGVGDLVRKAGQQPAGQPQQGEQQQGQPVNAQQPYNQIRKAPEISDLPANSQGQDSLQNVAKRMAQSIT